MEQQTRELAAHRPYEMGCFGFPAMANLIETPLPADIFPTRELQNTDFDWYIGQKRQVEPLVSFARALAARLHLSRLRRTRVA
jgi:hypothetical protein